MALRGFFVTGTDTGIGKTYVSRLLVGGLATLGPVTYQKPVQTGCVAGPNGLRAPDFDMVAQSGAFPLEQYEWHVPYRYVPACSPHLAAEQAGERIELEAIIQRMQRLFPEYGYLVAEGAGGLMVPLSSELSTLDLIRASGLDVLVVTSPRLGTLNHTFLTLEVLRHGGLAPAGVVFNNHSNLPEDAVYRDNRAMIAARCAPAAFVEVGYRAALDQPFVEFCHALARR